MADLFFDGFNTALNPAVWAFPVGAPSFYGRTQVRASLPTVSGGLLHLTLDTYNPTARVPGDSFYGSEVRTQQLFGSPTGSNTVVFEARSRLNNLIGGVVGGIFPFYLYDNSGAHDEIDSELLGNNAASHTTQYLTNIYSHAPLDAGRPQAVPASGGPDLTQFHDYRMEWRTDSVRWFVDGVLVRTDTTNIPTHAMAMHLNFWAPRADFAQAFNAGLQPVSTAAANSTFGFDSDYVSVSQISAGALGVNRLFDPASGIHFLTSSEAEKAAILTSLPALRLEGTGFQSIDPGIADPGRLPVYRFFNPQNGDHFFTISEGERAAIVASRGPLAFEGIGFFEHAVPTIGDLAVYRFFNTQDGSHFYTASTAERDALAGNPNAHLRLEGIAFYSPS